MCQTGTSKARAHAGGGAGHAETGENSGIGRPARSGACSVSNTAVPDSARGGSQSVLRAPAIGPDNLGAGIAMYAGSRSTAGDFHSGEFDGRSRSGRALRAPHVRQAARVHARRDRDPGARDWRQHRDLHRGQRGRPRAAAVCGGGPARAGDGRPAGPRRVRHRRVGARVVRLPRSIGSLRGDRRRVPDRRQPDGGGRSRTCRGAARQPVVLLRAGRARAARADLRRRGQPPGDRRGRRDQRCAVAPAVCRRARRARPQAAHRRRSLHDRGRDASGLPPPRAFAADGRRDVGAVRLQRVAVPRSGARRLFPVRGHRPFEAGAVPRGSAAADGRLRASAPRRSTRSTIPPARRGLRGSSRCSTTWSAASARRC